MGHSGSESDWWEDGTLDLVAHIPAYWSEAEGWARALVLTQALGSVHQSQGPEGLLPEGSSVAYGQLAVLVLTPLAKRVHS